jgi:hypothetical protein
MVFTSASSAFKSPVVAEKLPTGHAVHVVKEGGELKYPALHEWHMAVPPHWFLKQPHPEQALKL